jgi:sugar transferase (PEP-CTERM/EpsH1 system associated)
MRILFLAHRLPYPPDKGEKIRSYHLLSHLAHHHDVDLACFSDDSSDRQAVAALQQWCNSVVTVPWSRGPALAMAAWRWACGDCLTIGAYRDARMSRHVADLGRRPYDAVVAFSACMAPYALVVRARRRVLDLCDADSEKWLEYARVSLMPWSMIYRAEAVRLRQLELDLASRFDATTVITDRERRVLDPSKRNRRLCVLTNGVHLPGANVALPSSRPPVVTFVGTLDYEPNVRAAKWLVRRVWPAVRQGVPTAQLRILGRRPIASVRRLASVDGVSVHPDVPDVSALLRESRIVAAPLQIARGLQNKVLEAMAVGRPVVATSNVAACLAAESGRHLSVADEPADFADCVVRLCREDRLCDLIGRGGYRYAAAYHCWQDVQRRFEELLRPRQAARHGPRAVRKSADPLRESTRPAVPRLVR